MNTVIEFGGRRSGRTTRLIEWLQEDDNRVLMVFSQVEADRIKRLIKENFEVPIEDWRIVPYGRIDKIAGREISEVAIDNLEMMLPKVSAPITLITATLAEEYPTHHSHGFEPRFPVQIRHLS